jgi:putative spermidine/putrescine transport system permease protein
MAKAIDANSDEVFADDPRSLKRQLKRAERLTKLKFMALILPLAVFLLLVFVWPIGSLLMRSVDNPEVRNALPHTLNALNDWDGKALPNDAAPRRVGA